MWKLLVVGLLALGACGSPPASENLVDIDFGNLEPLNATEEADWQRDRSLVVKKFNERARATNRRMREAYERGQKACNKMRQAGYSKIAGCPRPPPNYTELMSDEIIQ